MPWLQSVFGSEGSPIVQYVVIFAVIFTALAAIVFTVRRLTGRSLTLPGRTPARGRQPRLGIVDVYELDRARQLILLRRDNVEHLLLVGGPNDVVVERNIQRTQRPLPEAALRADAGAEPMAEPLPDPLAQGGRLAEPPRALAEIAGRRSEPLFDPGFEMPVVVPPPVPRSAAAPPVTFPLDVSLLGGDEPGQEVSTPVVLQPRSTEAPAPAPPPLAPPLRETLSPRRILSRTAPPLADPRPNPASERKPEPAPEREEPVRTAPSLTVPSERRSVDPAVLSDMAKQLQAALSRPTSAVTPAPQAAAPAPGPVVDPVAATMAAATPPVPPAPPPREPAPSPAAAPEPPVVAPAPEPPVAQEPPRPSAPASPVAPPPPPPVPKVASPATPPAPPPAPRPEPKAAGNPFSVEEIEAEFARLLGRPLDKRT
ncbi:hypothetical protein SAMN05192568_1006215 [Methylobacterium pseudosasicola]|uniref:Flagellar biosynthesis protein, FliO n=1 Tax=Methylobacterium pseudosasicola TaxID=582667 RepID=A0A1I4IM52_9HYPH|nr:hypothetical protein SAMN05192568_1006215 [Methylobacterium pseudosasicola]